MSGLALIALFSYGTLRQADVQMANYGRVLDGDSDELHGYRLTPVEITNPEVVKVSGLAVHTIATATGDPEDRIEGMVFRLTEAELAATDAYETDAYARIEVALESGRLAWAYVAA